ncbi:MAG: MarR family transcriptional regulator [Chthoniobacter sp.]|uniref:MarR family winged helix-turn-helix transcriptional regulator n=1 Tax=Chthoniobacter sp. TaxID=2510640 RepID=UPI0032AC9336
MTKSEYEILAAFRYELRKYLHFSEQAAQQEELSPQKYQALLAIQGFPGRSEVTIGELAEQLQIVAHSAVGLVDRLEDDGLIRRQPSKEDRRCVFVKLTPRGKTILEKLASVHREELETVGPLLTGFLARVSTGKKSSKRDLKSPKRTSRGASDRGPVERRPNASPVCYAPEED